MTARAHSRHGATTLALLVLGVLLLVPFDAWFTLAAGIACLLGFVVSGVLLIAAPVFLEADETPE
jgi:hypothetical protein